MGPKVEEIARTLLHGRLPATLRISGRADDHETVHATDPHGDPLLLVPDGSPLGAQLRGNHGPDGPLGALTVDDAPPFDNAPSLGRATVLGPVRPVAPGAIRQAVLDFADGNPAAGLFDVGQGVCLYRLDVRQVRLGLDGTLHRIDVDDYRGSGPDPLHDEEKDLLVDLAKHHAAEIGGFLADSLAAAGIRVPALPLPVRLDQYGFVVALDPAAARPRCLRLDFPVAMRSRHRLAHFLHPILFHRCQHGGAEDRPGPTGSATP
ncbi:DUF2470 domain-containing protein [Phytohabitans sp. ZYX-F-186]|uniref:DUF2470 domain-containing protein n=1 Tax=Phytohabitans maris TaxID=3071409 RepID=A0ABU0ZUN9_9ACTN|nr:DUF2470 domain-containing protein [Phytohabitans sp. ZYX-F-186]MDQ7909890.1 DUF2470 domain-containing protein [Phytohabitans sp. ZYX-F-186]